MKTHKAADHPSGRAICSAAGLVGVMREWRGLGILGRIFCACALLLASLNTAHAFVVLPHLPRRLNALSTHERRSGRTIELGAGGCDKRRQKEFIALKAGHDLQENTAVALAEDNREGSKTADIGFSFSVAGLFFSYHLGVAEVLRREGFLDDHTPLAGASGGTLAAVAIALGLDGRKVVERTEQMCREIRADGKTTKGRLAQLVRPVIDEILPEDAHTRLNSYPGGVHLGVYAWKPLPSATTISSFNSREDLIDVMLASSHFPFWLSPWPFKRLRWFLSMDGFFGFRDEFGCPKTPAAATVCVSPFLEEQVFKRKTVDGGDGRKVVVGHGDGVISPQMLLDEGRGKLEELLPVALNPSDDDQLLAKTYDGGMRDAQAWVKQWKSRS